MSQNKDTNVTAKVSKEIMTIEELSELFSGRDVMTVKGQGVADAKKWIEGDKAHLKAYACTVFYEKPLRYVIRGQKTKDGSTANSLDPKIAKYLPMLDPDQTVGEKRKEYGPFARVNMSRIRNVALLNAEYGIYHKTTADNWRARYGGKPSELNFDNNFWIGMLEESRSIKKGGIEKFNEELVYMLGSGLLYFPNESNAGYDSD